MRKDKGKLEVKLQFLEDGVVVDEMDGNALIGVVITPCNCGKEGCITYETIISGEYSLKDIIIAKYAIDKGIDEYIEKKRILLENE